jgi:hypothetical protein
MTLTRKDHAAMNRAIALTRAEDEGRRQQVDHKLQTEGFQETGEFCAYHCQMQSLRLRPWQIPPIWSDHQHQRGGDQPFGDDADATQVDDFGLAAARQLLRKMRALGISKYDPTPLESIAAAEAAQRRGP